MYRSCVPESYGGDGANDIEYLDTAFVDPKLLTKSTIPSMFALNNLFRPRSLLDKAEHNTW